MANSKNKKAAMADKMPERKPPPIPEHCAFCKKDNPKFELAYTAGGHRVYKCLGCGEKTVYGWAYLQYVELNNL